MLPMDFDRCLLDRLVVLLCLPCSYTLLLASSSSCWALVESVLDENDDGIVPLLLVFDFLRVLSSDTSRAPSPFLDLFEGTLVERVNVED